MLIAAACTSSSTGSDSAADNGDGTETIEADDADGPRSRVELKPTINLAVTDWTAAHLNAAIAERIIEFQLGYPVEAIEAIDTGQMMLDLRAGEIDAVLELWPSTLGPGELELLSTGEVEPLGDLGVVGKVGWYVPRFVVDDDPSLGAWQGFDNSAVAARFATDETGDRGRFLGTDPNYEQADEQLIEALDLPFEVVYSGSEQATAAEVDRAIRFGDPVILFWWTPTAEITRFDLVEVALPPRTTACEAEIEAGQPQSCDYHPDHLFKAGSPLLAEKAPDVRQFLANFTLTTEEQLDLIDRVENDGRTVAAVAEEWVTNNSSKWTDWLG